MKKKLSKIDWVYIVVIIVCVLGELLLPATGKLVLLDELCGGVIVAILGLWFLKGTAITWSSCGWKNRILFSMLTVLMLGVSMILAKDAALDLIQGSTTVELTDCSVEKRSGSLGVIGLDYYLWGTDADGKEYRFTISGSDYERLKREKEVTVLGYVNTERVIAYR